MITFRELVYCTLACDGPPRAPRDLWPLPVATEKYPAEYAALGRDFPLDIAGANGRYRMPLLHRGDPHVVGNYVDEWGCTFINIQRGVIGEVKDPPVKDWERDRWRVHIPREELSVGVEAVNRECTATEICRRQDHEIPRLGRME